MSHPSPSTLTRRGSCPLTVLPLISRRRRMSPRIHPSVPWKSNPAALVMMLSSRGELCRGHFFSGSLQWISSLFTGVISTGVFSPYWHSSILSPSSTELTSVPLMPPVWMLIWYVCSSHKHSNCWTVLQGLRFGSRYSIISCIYFVPYFFLWAFWQWILKLCSYGLHLCLDNCPEIWCSGDMVSVTGSRSSPWLGVLSS